MELFESKKTKGIKSHIANLVAIAQSDGKFSVAEKKLVFEIGERNGITKEKVKKIIKSDKPIKFKVPVNDSDRFDRLYDLVEMVLADGIKTENEMDALIEIAEKLEFRKAIVGVLVNKIIRGIEDPEKTKEVVRIECGQFLNF
ncbi:MAG: hypothetical protein ACK4ND_19810 [Cytophagaceae bacterium]